MATMLSSPAQATIVISCIFPALAILATALRCYARRAKRLALQADDFLILAALILTVGSCVLYIIGATIGGVGTHINDLTQDEFTRFGKILFALQFLYLGAVALIKLSILSFYKRLFPTRKFTIAVSIMSSIVVLWFITFFFATMFQALPLSVNWTGGAGTIINEYAMYTATAAIEILLDIVTLAMPWSVIWTLHMDTHRKLAVIGIFMLGGFVCVASIVRLYYLIIYLDPTAEQTEDFTYDTSNIVIWSAIEPCAGVVCACLPILGPLFKGDSPLSLLRSVRSFFSLRSLYSNASRSTLQAGKEPITKRSYDSMSRPFAPMPDEGIVLTAIDHGHSHMAPNTG